MSRSSPPSSRLVIAGGGTCGHLFPGVAIAREFLSRNPANAVLFVIPGRPLEQRELARQGLAWKVLRSRGLRGKSPAQQLAALGTVPRALGEALSLLREFRADTVLGVGSYCSGPVVLAAKMLGLVTALQEQNSVLGATNRLLCRLVDRLYVAYADSVPVSLSRLTRWTGNPLRPEILEALSNHEEPRDPSAPLAILVLGGTHGAPPLNQAMIEALPDLRGRSLQFVHQTGPEDEGRVRAAYQRMGFPAVVQSYSDSLGTSYRQSDLVLCRAGGLTIAEIQAAGKPALYVPFPLAAGNHQESNAAPSVQAGAAEVILQRDLSGELLARRIAYYAEHRSQLVEMGARARAMARPQAVQELVDDLANLT